MKTSTFLFTLKTALFGLLLLTASCKKDSEEAVTPDGGSGSTLACVGKNLRLAALNFDPAIDLDGDGKLDNDLLKFMDDCARDNTIVFEKNGKLSGSEGAKVCPNTGDDSPTSYGPSTWTYNPQTRILRIVANGDATDVTEWKVLDVSGSQLKATIATESGDGTDMKMVMTWQAQ